MRRAYSIPEKYLLYVGGFDFRKNVPRIIESFARVLARSKETYRLVICGDIDRPQRDPLAAMIEKLGIGANVVFTGFVPDADLPVLYSGAEAFLFPSLYEGFGLPVIEAMACGCPVVTSNNSSLKELSDAAMCVDPTDTDALTDAICAILSDEDYKRRLSRQGMEKAKQFSWDAAAQKMIRFADTVMQKA
jgi:glycosyltransferase involved in cell wall biosynthesis